MRGRGGGRSGGWRRRGRGGRSSGGGTESEDELVRLSMEVGEEQENRREGEMEMENEDMGYEQEEEYVAEEEEEEERNDTPVPPKLDEGFYEIEDVRKKRVRKGHVQFLIKWRGWPETANTWEPLENLKSCSEMIEAFEQRSLSGKTRKRRRKSGALLTHTKKRQQRSTSGSKVGRSSGALSSASVENSSPFSAPTLDGVNASRSVTSKDHGNDEEEKNENGNNGEIPTPAQQTENGSSSICPRDGENKEGFEFGVDLNLSELKGGTPSENLNSENGKVSINLSDTMTSDKGCLTDGLSKQEFGETVQGNRFTGAKKRKSGCVRRFTALSEQEETQNGRSTMEDKLETVTVEYGEVPVGDDKNKMEDLKNPPFITKIIKPIGYQASISHNVQDVCIQFMAMRSDGKEVVVDNKILKANNPDLLIEFYEQHLHYTPPPT